MGQRAKVTQLPDEVRQELEKKIVQRGFAGYDALETWLASVGISISKSAIHRYGQKLEQRLAAIKASTEAAKLIAAETQDDADDRSAAVISMIQTEVFETLVGLRELEDPDVDPMKRTEILSKLSKNWATLTRASVALKRHSIEIRGKAEAVAARAERLMTKGGLSADTVESIKREILGIAG